MNQFNLTERLLRVICLLVVGMGGSLSALADSELDAVVPLCQQCHASSSSPLIPILDGLPESYLLSQLKAFRSQERGGDQATSDAKQMHALANALSDAQLAQVSDYYAGLPLRHSQARLPNLGGDVKRGEALFDQRECRACHFSWMGRFFSKSPQVNQQPGGYLQAQLLAFQNGSRAIRAPSETQQRMLNSVQDLTEQQLTDILTYLETLKKEAQD